MFVRAIAFARSCVNGFHRMLRYSGHGFDRQTRSLPFGITVLEPADAIAARAERRDRLERENAIRAAAIGNDLAVRRKLAQAMLEFAKRDTQRARKMP